MLYSAKMRSSSPTTASFLSSHVYSGRHFSPQKSVYRVAKWKAQLIGRDLLQTTYPRLPEA